MSAEVIELEQGSPEWHAHRSRCGNASEASAMLGISSYKSRTDLLKEKSTGIVPEVDDATQRRFDRGHELEAMAKPWAEEIIGDELDPTVMAWEIDGMPLSVSVDGLNATDDANPLGSIIWEHKTLNNTLREALSNQTIPEEYHPQMEQGLLITGADRCLFMASNGDKETMLYAWYESNPDLRKRILAGWKQFWIDVAEYQHVEHAKPIAGKAPDNLPALRIEVTGMVTASNLKEFKAHALEVFDGINTDLVTDEDFANAERTVKWCKEVEDKLDAAKQHALSQTATIDELFRAIDDIKEQARQKRRTLDKVVKSRKESIRTEMANEYQGLLQMHVKRLNDRLGGQWMAVPTGTMGQSIKCKKTIAGCHDALETELANQKIFANEMADRLEENRNLLTANGHDWWHLFQHDFAKVGQYESEIFSGLLAQRITDEEKRVEAAKLRAEQAKLAQAAVKHEEAKIVEATTPEPIKASVVSARLRAQIVTELEDLNESQLMKVMETIAIIRSGVDKKAA